ncbi:MAG: DUF3592 domain-containing protein [Chloroflexi bacterium]|nr:DUF3592 domain-containing protein [Chloroflexota bacterium]
MKRRSWVVSSILALATIVGFLVLVPFVDRHIDTRSSGVPRNQPVFFTLVILGMGGCFSSLVVVNPLLKRITRRNRSHWTETTGRVISSTAGNVSPDDREQSTDSYFMSVQFTYEIGGVVYSGKQHWYSDSKVEHAPNTPITIYYDPHNQKKAVVHRESVETPWITGVLFMVSLLLFFLGVILGYWR